MRLDTRPSQWIGVVLLLGWTLLLAEVLPRVAYALPSEVATVTGQPVSVAGVSLTPADGWGRASGVDEILILRKGGAQLTAAPGQPVSGDVTPSVQAFLDGLKDDPDSDWHVSEPQAFTTTDGLEGLYAVGLLPQEFVLQADLVEGGTSYTVTATGSDTAWTSLHDEIIQMLETLQVEQADA